MKEHNPSNERIKRQYFTYLREARRFSEATVDAVAKALARFEADTDYRDFKRFHYEQAVAFKRHLATHSNQLTGERLSKATLYATLAHLKRFFQWLSGQPGYKSRLCFSDSEYFNLSEKESRVATARHEKSSPTVDQVRHVISAMPVANDVQRRNRALVAFILLTGARDTATASLKLKHVDLQARCVYQDARDVDTKFSKTFTTYFFPVGEDVIRVIEDWLSYLSRGMLWGNNDPLFPATDVRTNANHQFQAMGIKRQHWRNAGPIRTVFRDACALAGLPYFNPHSLRSTLAKLGESLCRTPEQFKAWSQNLGHEGVLTTFYSYGSVSGSRQREIIQSLNTDQPSLSVEAATFAKAVARELRGFPSAT